jgi:ArsR family transcriptional regulator, arsenate/arsenite/antimonite-responsive transcriptional repressor
MPSTACVNADIRGIGEVAIRPYDPCMASRTPSLLPMLEPPVIAVPGDRTLEVLRALAHPLRLELLAHVAARGPVCSCHLEADIDASQPQISKHLGVLHRAGLLERRREGRWIYFSIKEDALDTAGELVDELKASMRRPHLADHCDDPPAG